MVVASQAYGGRQSRESGLSESEQLNPVADAALEVLSLLVLQALDFAFSDSEAGVLLIRLTQRGRGVKT